MKRRSYTIKHKLEVCDWFYNKGNRNVHKTSKEYTIDRKTVKEWLSKEDKYREMANNRFMSIKKRRTLEYPRVPLFPEIDSKVLELHKQMRSKGLAVTREIMTDKALIEYNELKRTSTEPIADFKASSGWMTGFIDRNKIISRTPTSVGQKIPENARELALNFFEYIERWRETDRSQQNAIYNVDEVPMYFDSPTLRTYDDIGAKSVPIKTTGYEKMRFTLMLCADNLGRKVRPAIIFKNLKKVPNKKFPVGIDIYVSESGSVNRDLMTEWTKKTFGNRPGGLFVNCHPKRQNPFECRTLLTLDAARPHLLKSFSELLATNYDTHVAIIPGGMTPLLQPADVS